MVFREYKIRFQILYGVVLRRNTLARTICRCGEVLSNHRIPNDVELIVYTSKQWEEATQVTFVEDIPDPNLDVWQCPKCDRLLFLSQEF